MSQGTKGAPHHGNILWECVISMHRSSDTVICSASSTWNMIKTNQKRNFFQKDLFSIFLLGFLTACFWFTAFFLIAPFLMWETTSVVSQRSLFFLFYQYRTILDSRLLWFQSCVHHERWASTLWWLMAIKNKRTQNNKRCYSLKLWGFDYFTPDYIH